MIATLNQFGDIRCPHDDCNVNIIKPIDAHYVPGTGKCEHCGKEFELTQVEIDKFKGGE